MISATAAVVALGAAPFAAAQNSGQSGQSTQRDQQQQYGSQQQQYGQQGSAGWDPQSVTVIGYDFDQDGVTDAWQTVARYDYDRLRNDRTMQPSRSSMQRNAMGRGGMAQNQGFNRMDMRRGQNAWGNPMQQRQQAMQQQRLQGTLKDITSFSFANDGDEKHLVGKLQLDNGRTVPVHFGREQNLAVDLQKGDQIQVIGRIGTLNDHKIVLADQVRTGQGQFRVARNDDGNVKAIKGQVVAIEPVALQDGRTSMLTKIRTDNGRTVIAACGPKDALQADGLNVRKGDTIALLAKPASINGRPIMLSTWAKDDQGDCARIAPSQARLRRSGEFAQAYRSLQSSND